MNVLLGIEGLKRIPKGSVLSIGNFDGVHRGHQHILQKLQSLKQPSSSLAIATFEPHPFTVLRPHLAPPRLTSPTMKQRLLEELGVTHYVVLPPTHDVLNVSAEEFWAILRDDVQPSHLVEGRDFTFGKGRAGNIDRLREWASHAPVQLHIADAVHAPLLDLTIVPVSSSIIRYLVAFGRVRDAAICLGRPYVLEGEVIQGYQRGRTIGVPTANLQVKDQLIPADGVYAGRVHLSGRTFAAAVSIGTTPTFEGQKHQVEAHLLDFVGDLYGHTVQLQLIDWIRDQRRFNGVDALKSQLGRDFVEVRNRAKRDVSRPIAKVN
jgi:riboflavin kinase/FMN adenylyltransferase